MSYSLESNHEIIEHNVFLTLFLWVPFINTLRPRQNGRHFADDTFNRIFVNENVRISIKFSLKFVPTGPINNIPALVQIMAWRRPGGKPLSEPVMVSLLTYICVTRPQWINSLTLRDVVIILQMQSPKSPYGLNSWALPMKLLPQSLFHDRLILVQLMLSAVRQQSFTWANVDPDLLAYGVNRPLWVNKELGSKHG